MFFFVAGLRCFAFDAAAAGIVGVFRVEITMVVGPDWG